MITKWFLDYEMQKRFKVLLSFKLTEVEAMKKTIEEFKEV